eukprot:s1133_g13.t1
MTDTPSRVPFLQDLLFDLIQMERTTAQLEQAILLTENVLAGIPANQRPALHSLQISLLQMRNALQSLRFSEVFLCIRLLESLEDCLLHFGRLPRYRDHYQM